MLLEFHLNVVDLKKDFENDKTKNFGHETIRHPCSNMLSIICFYILTKFLINNTSIKNKTLKNKTPLKINCVTKSCVYCL